MTANPSVYEQYLLELINRARANPNAEASLFGIDLNQGLSAGEISAAPKQPLVLNEYLIAAARAHSDWMLATDTFSHTGVNGSSPGDRMAAAGYSFGVPSGWGENIAYTASTGSLNPTAETVANHKNLFLSPGHRENLMDPDFKEVGLATQIGEFSNRGTSFNAMMVTENFAFDGIGSFLTGVVLNDADGDRFYDIGEGVGSATITASGAAGTFQTTSWGAGGYSLELPSGNYAVTISHGGRQVTSNVAIGNQNVKLDATLAEMVAGTTPPPGPGVGTSGNDVFQGATGSQNINGGAGLDTIVYAGSHIAYGWTLQGGGNLTVSKPGGGQDTLASVERVAFDTGILATDVGVNQIAGQAYRIYQAAFDRTPDNGGLIYWIDRLDDGANLYAVGQGFVASREFRDVYGASVSNTDFIERLYENILGREGEAAGIDFWVGQLDSGARDKASVLVGFSESAENVALVGQAINNGIWLDGAAAA